MHWVELSGVFDENSYCNVMSRPHSPEVSTGCNCPVRFLIFASLSFAIFFSSLLSRLVAATAGLAVCDICLLYLCADWYTVLALPLIYMATSWHGRSRYNYRWHLSESNTSLELQYRHSAYTYGNPQYFTHRTCTLTNELLVLLSLTTMIVLVCLYIGCMI